MYFVTSLDTTFGKGEKYVCCAIKNSHFRSQGEYTVTVHRITGLPDIILTYLEIFVGLHFCGSPGQGRPYM